MKKKKSKARVKRSSSQSDVHDGETVIRRADGALLYKLLVEIVIIGALLSATVEFAIEGYVDVFMYCPFGEKCGEVAESGSRKIDIAIGSAWLMFFLVSAIVLVDKAKATAMAKKSGGA